MFDFRHLVKRWAKTTTISRLRAYRGCLKKLTTFALLGQSLFPADNPWNQRIDQAPVAANSSAIMNSIIGTYGNGMIRADFSQNFGNSGPLYGIPYNVVHGNTTASLPVVIDGYPEESDLQNVPIPTGAVLEGDMQNGPTVGLNNRGDSHLIVWNEDANVAYELYGASRPSENADGQWHAVGEAVWNMNTNSFRTLGWTSADAAGLAILPGLARPDEGLPTSEGGQGVINHALRFTLQNAVILDQFLYPASHVANPGNTNSAIQPPMGARFRLKASVDISSLNPESRVIAQAMKDYGLIVADNGANFFISGASSSVDANNHSTLTWNDNDIHDSLHGLKSLPFSDFEVVALTPIVTGLSAPSGAPGSQVTITGQNFSGAAGRLQVLFGSTPATSVTVVDDSHVVAVVPSVSGTVDVRVQSGVSDPSDPENINSPIFGYGISATSAADRFSPLLSPTWAQDRSGTWCNSSNWTGSLPLTPATPALLGTVVTAARTVTLDANVTLANLTFSTTGAGSYTLSPSSGTTLTMSNGTGNATINVLAGTQVIGVPLLLASSTVVSDTGLLTISNTVSTAANNLTIGTGTLKAYAVSGSGSTTVAAGATLQVNYIHEHQLTVAAGGKVVLGGVTAPAAAPASAGTVPGSYADISSSATGVAPEPSTFILFGIGAVSLLGYWLRQSMKAKKED